MINIMRKRAILNPKYPLLITYEHARPKGNPTNIEIIKSFKLNTISPETTFAEKAKIKRKIKPKERKILRAPVVVVEGPYDAAHTVFL